MNAIPLGPESTDERFIRAAITRSGKPYLSVVNDEGDELAAVFVAINPKTGVIEIDFDQYRDCSARYRELTIQDVIARIPDVINSRFYRNS